MHRSPSRVLAATAVGLVTLLLSGCGQTAPATRGDGGSPSAAVSPSTTPTGSAGPSWLIRLDTYSGEDGETRQAHYVVFRPAAGAVSAIRLPRVQVPQMSGDERALLVDAGRRWVLADSRPSGPDRTRGLVRMYDVTNGHARTVDVRRASGDRGLESDWVAFDPSEPGLIRVVSGRTVWAVQTDEESPKAHKEGVLPRRAGWIYGGGFDKNTGTPYIEDIDSFRTDPPGNGDLDKRPLRRSGGRLLITDNGSYRGLPDPRCDLSSGFVEAGGAATIFCFDRHTVTEKTLTPGASTWKTGPSATSPDIPGQGDPMFTFPGPDA